MKNMNKESIAIHTEDELSSNEKPEKFDEENSFSCQVRRKIEDYLEKRRYKEEFGSVDEEFR